MGRASTMSMVAMSMVAPPVSSRDEDHELVAAVRAGDDRAFEVLYERYRERITGFVNGYVKDHARAEDVTQEVFFSASRRMRASEGAIAFRPWIYEIARNACIDQFRRSSSRVQELSFDEQQEGLGIAEGTRLVAPEDGPEEAAGQAERLNDLYGALGDLSESHHRILVLRELEGRSYQEIGERMGISKAGVESTLFRARKRLCEQYDDIATGRRCVRVCTTVALAAETATELRAREQRSVGRHLSHCGSCRAFVHSAGVEVDVPERSWLAERLRILFPLPAFMRRGSSGHGGELSARLGTALGPQAEPLANGAAKIATAAAALAVAVLGTGVVAHQSGGRDRSPGGSTAAAGPAAALRPAVPGGFAPKGGTRAPSGAASATAGPRRSTTSTNGASPSRARTKTRAKKDRAGGSSAGGSSSTSRAGKAPGGGDSSAGGGSSNRSSAGGAGDTVRRTGQNVGGAVENAGQGAGGAVRDTGQSVGGAVQQTGQSVGQTVGAVSPAAGNTVTGTTQTAGGAVSGATQTAGGAVSGATQTAGGAVSGATGAAGGAVGGLTGGG
jgi:RNA polymerase sigma factor (sigma-70 family)